MPINKCAICKQLQFEKNMRNISEYLQQVYLYLTGKDKRFPMKRICASCKRALENGKLSQFTTPKQIRANRWLPLVATLSKLGKVFVSLRIGFAQMRQWGYKLSRMGLMGSIINVLVHMDIVQKTLPRFKDETTTIAIPLKRKPRYKNSYQMGKVHAYIVMETMKQLCSRDLYKA